MPTYVDNILDGIFFIGIDAFMNDFDDIQIGYYVSGHTNNYLEVLSDDSTLKYYTFTTTSVADAYILVGFYNQRMYPYSCKTVTT